MRFCSEWWPDGHGARPQCTNCIRCATYRCANGSEKEFGPRISQVRTCKLFCVPAGEIFCLCFVNRTFITTISYSARRTNPLTYNSYLMSPIVEIIVGQGENETTLTAHQTLLLESPFLAEMVNKFSETEPVCFVVLC